MRFALRPSVFSAADPRSIVQSPKFMKTQTLTQKFLVTLAACLLSVVTVHPATINQNPADNYVAWEAENQVVINNAGTAAWAVVSDSRGSGGSVLMEQGTSDTANAASTAAWTLIFQTPGTYQLYVKYMLDPCCGANSYKFPNAFGGAFGPTDPAWTVSSANENGAGPVSYTVIRERQQNTQNFAVFTVNPGDVGIPITLMFGNREAPGLRIDRVILSTDTTLADNGGAGFDALANSPLGFGVLRAGTQDDSLTSVCLRFTRPPDPTAAIDTSHYSINNGVTISGAAISASDPAVVILTTSPLTSATTYTYTVSNLSDTGLPPNVIVPNPASGTFVAAGPFTVGRIVYNRYENIGGWQVSSQFTTSS